VREVAAGERARAAQERDAALTDESPRASNPTAWPQVPVLLGMADVQKHKQLRMLAFGDSITGVCPVGEPKTAWRLRC
jgi:hypothetical protein